MSLLTPKQVAARLNCSLLQVSRLCSSGQLPHHKFRRWVRIDESDLEAWLARTKQGESQHRPTPNAEVRAALAIVVGPGRNRTKKQTTTPE